MDFRAVLGVVIHDTYGTRSNSATYVQQVLQPVQTHAVGPNQVIAPPRPSPQGTNATNVVTSPTPTPSLQLTGTDPPETQEPLWALIKRNLRGPQPLQSLCDPILLALLHLTPTLLRGRGLKCHLQLIHSLQPTAVFLGRLQGGPYHERSMGFRDLLTHGSYG